LLLENTVDGSEIRRSPVEGTVAYPKILYIQTVANRISKPFMVVYPIIYKVSKTSKRWFEIAGCLNHQQCQWYQVEILGGPQLNQVVNLHHISQNLLKSLKSQVIFKEFLLFN